MGLVIWFFPKFLNIKGPGARAGGDFVWSPAALKFALRTKRRQQETEGGAAAVKSRYFKAINLFCKKRSDCANFLTV